MILQQIFENIRVDELTFPKDKEKAGDILNQYGYKRLDDGESSYAAVYHKPGEQSVLKLYDKKDHAFTAFVDFCRMQSNVHFPIFSRSSVEIKGTNYRAIKTELLTKGNFDELYNASINGDEIILHRAPIDLNSPSLVKFTNDFPIKSKEYIQWLGANKSLAEAFMLLKDHFIKNRKINFDLNSSNMMMRGDTIVIIDPIAPKY